MYKIFSKITKRWAEKITHDESGAKEASEKIYKNYVFSDIDIKYSGFVSGCYIYARMRKYKRKIENDKAKITRIFVVEEKHRTAWEYDRGDRLTIDKNNKYVIRHTEE